MSLTCISPLVLNGFNQCVMPKTTPTTLPPRPRKLMMSTDHIMTDEELMLLIDEADTRGNGSVSEDQFQPDRSNVVKDFCATETPDNCDPITIYCEETVGINFIGTCVNTLVKEHYPEFTEYAIQYGIDNNDYSTLPPKLLEKTTTLPPKTPITKTTTLPPSRKPIAKSSFVDATEPEGEWSEPENDEAMEVEVESLMSEGKGTALGATDDIAAEMTDTGEGEGRHLSSTEMETILSSGSYLMGKNGEVNTIDADAPHFKTLGGEKLRGDRKLAGGRANAPTPTCLGYNGWYCWFWSAAYCC